MWKHYFANNVLIIWFHEFWIYEFGFSSRKSMLLCIPKYIITFKITYIHKNLFKIRRFLGYRIECVNLMIFFSIFTACQCNNQAKECNHKTGRCHCTTKGIIGEKCDRCDIVNHYYGDPVKNSCYCKYTSEAQIN